MDGGVVVAYVVSYLLGGLTRLVDRELDDGLTRLFNAVKSKVQGKPAWCALANAPTDDGRQRQLREVVDSGAQDDPRWAAEVAELQASLDRRDARKIYIDAPGSDNVVVGINEGIVVRDGMVVVMDAPRLPTPPFWAKIGIAVAIVLLLTGFGLFGYAVLNAGPRRPPEVGFPAALSFAGVVVFFLSAIASMLRRPGRTEGRPGGHRSVSNGSVPGPMSRPRSGSGGVGSGGQVRPQEADALGRVIVGSALGSIGIMSLLIILGVYEVFPRPYELVGPHLILVLAGAGLCASAISLHRRNAMLGLSICALGLLAIVADVAKTSGAF
jgi:hypothetical protein